MQSVWVSSQSWISLPPKETRLLYFYFPSSFPTLSHHKLITVDSNNNKKPDRHHRLCTRASKDWLTVVVNYNEGRNVQELMMIVSRVCCTCHKCHVLPPQKNHVKLQVNERKKCWNSFSVTLFFLCHKAMFHLFQPREPPMNTWESFRCSARGALA